VHRPSQSYRSPDRQHLSYDACLEVRGKIIRTVLCCIMYWSCAQSYAHLGLDEQFLQFSGLGFVPLEPWHVCLNKAAQASYINLTVVFQTFSGQNYFFFQTFQGILFIFMWTKSLQNWLLNAEISYTMYMPISLCVDLFVFVCVYFVCFCFILYSCRIIVSVVGWTWLDWRLVLRTLSSFSALTLLVWSFDP